MLPATLAHEVRKQVLHYLEATFNTRHRQVEEALRRFFDAPENGLFKGPWLSLRRPYRRADDNGQGFFDIPVPFAPFRHQWRAWQRLTSKGRKPKHTLVTSGTGSGKTECFMLPVLDHCWREHAAGRRDGIKAIVLYPMNALAADQAGRFAEEILTSDLLSYAALVGGKPIRKAHVRVGLYTGRMQPGQEDRGANDAGTPGASADGGEPDGTYREMRIVASAAPGGKAVYTAITNRAAMQESPPDILLTNYKMLDFLLMRPRDQGIWRHNHGHPERLRYLVLDELHTYDGAQGADVACLIRRLKARLGIPRGELCVVGTSATIAGSDDETTDDPLQRLCQFASSLFEEDIQSDAVMEEDRYRIEEIIRPAQAGETIPAAERCLPGERETAQQYAARIAPLFGAPAFPAAAEASDGAADGEPAATEAQREWGLALGDWLRAQPLFHALLRVTERGAVEWAELIRRLSAESFALRALGDFDARSQAVAALLALVAQARELRSGRAFPLVPTQVQFWIRELRRIGRVVAMEPVFSWLDEPLAERKQLPTVHCTECGESAWVALHDPDKDALVQQKVAGFALDDDPRRIYEGWGFEHHPSRRLVILSPWPEGDDPLPADGQQQLAITRYWLAPTELTVRAGPGPGPLTGEETFPVKVANGTRRLERSNQLVGEQRCPHCQAENSLMFLGARAATTASVAIDEVFGSLLNNDPKLLAFTDSVQDASHRAGFFTARTYHFTLRTALQHVIDDAGPAGLPLEQVADRLLAYWSENASGRPGSVREVMATLMPPDLREYGAYLEMRGSAVDAPPAPGLLADFRERLNWQAVSEFSLMLTHGRTMELHASACLGWDEAAIDDTLRRLRARLPGISPALDRVADTELRLWIVGILHRQRERGGLYHPFLDSYARQNYWGKYPFGRTVPGREIYPPAGRYRPRLMVTERDRFHDFVLAPAATGQQTSWQLVWARRVLGVPAVDDAVLLDLLDALLQEGTAAGLLRHLHTDGSKACYALAGAAARLYPHGRKLACNGSGHVLFRPAAEAALWEGAPSLAYRDNQGRYAPAALNDREGYYRQRYRKGALRRVFAHEHTGLLTTEEREALELSFNIGGHADDPNVLTATSTLEMGIDIGDLSTTLLCSVPPSVASYLQRIGRAGRSTGTALILAIINQRPHDLFFFARPADLLDGKVEPPGCWLDAGAVLVRQYLAYCFDQGVAAGVLTDLPGSGKQLVDEVIVNKAGHIPGLIAWMTANEAELQQGFLARFSTVDQVLPDTVERFTAETRTECLRERIERAAREFNSQRQLLQNARKRLTDQKQKLDPQAEPEAVAEIEREQKILSARTRKLGEISALEVLIEHGLLPNYAFPERGVRFSGTTYNEYAEQAAAAPRGQDGARGEERANRVKTFDLVRSGAAAIRELAPANHFYTHSHKFDIQQLEVGSRSQPLVEEWAVCGKCGHLRTVAEVKSPEAVPACPQCGYDGPDGQTDVGQHRTLLPLHRSQAVSYMEYYDSLSADRGDERENELYRLVSSFDLTVAQAGGAVGDEQLPFGIEYRSAVRMREINTGYTEQPEVVAAGEDIMVPEGFEICAGCGVVVEPGKTRADVKHRRSCPGRRQTETLQREGRAGNAYQWQQAWLYRELRSEAIRLLLPDVEDADLDTLEACLYLGLRLRFQGDPAHLMVRPQRVPDPDSAVTKRYLVLMDAVPGGTGFLKALYQEADAEGRAGEGVLDSMRRALSTLTTCECRRLHHTRDDTDGCYRCIRTYHMQHRAENIGRERGIRLLQDLIAAGERRTQREALDAINTASLFGSVLEKRLVERLRGWVEQQGGQWQEALINGSRGFRFLLADPERAWELDRQPLLGPPQGVSIACQPDFLLRCDDPDVRPVAIFADGFEPHVRPGEPDSRLADDVAKRRALLDSGQYWVWSLSWDDLLDDDAAALAFLQPHLVQRILPVQADQLRRSGRPVPDLAALADNPWRQLQAFIRCPLADVWQALSAHAGGFSLVMLAGRGIGTESSAMQRSFEQWRHGWSVPPLGESDRGAWCWLNRLSLFEDLLAYAPVDQDLMASRFHGLRHALRLDDSEQVRAGGAAYRTRWRQCQALLNLFQFSGSLVVFTTSEAEAGTAPLLELGMTGAAPAAWQQVIDETIAGLVPFAKALAAAQCVVPVVEHYCDALGDQLGDVLGDELFAELAWPELAAPLAVLSGDQASFARQWQAAGWTVCTDGELKAKGWQWIIDLLPSVDGGTTHG
jgi:DEAD/DEAH box helicase domain-containing protein